MLGLKPEDDIDDIGPRFLKPPPAGPAKDKDIRKHLKWMVREYYRLMGWDEKTGLPYDSILERLGLKELLEEVLA